MYFETKRSCTPPDLDVSATCVRVPVMPRAHLRSHLGRDRRTCYPRPRAISLLKPPEWSRRDNPAEKQYPMPLFVAGKDRVCRTPSRRPRQPSRPVILGCRRPDQKGAALNAVQIAHSTFSNTEIIDLKYQTHYTADSLRQRLVKPQQMRFVRMLEQTETEIEGRDQAGTRRKSGTGTWRRPRPGPGLSLCNVQPLGRR